MNAAYLAACAASVSVLVVIRLLLLVYTNPTRRLVRSLKLFVWWWWFSFGRLAAITTPCARGSSTP
jgi:pheromone shutdown protein TraB